MLTFDQVKQHSTVNDCWCIIHGKVYNLSSFIKNHPGGVKVILKQAGKDATAAFDQVHPKDMVNMLPSGCLVGDIDISTLPVQTKSQKTVDIPPLSSILNLMDFEAVAEKVLSKEGWAYYSSAGDDEITFRENQDAFKRLWLNPKVLVNVKNVDTSLELFGAKMSAPFYISATALGKLGHPEGEVVLTRAAGTRNIVQMIPTLASCSFDELIQARIDGQTQWFQLYVNEDRNLTRRMVEKAEKMGCKALCITVDAPQLGRREKDMRVKFVDDAPDVHESQMDRSQGAGRAISSFIDASLCWDDIPWFLSITKMPILLKGIQSPADAIRACHSGVSGIIVSNHGGRQLDTCLASIEMLRLIMEELQRHGLREKIHVLLDGGIRRGTDVYKALALGAKCVGLGRPWLYAMSSYGQAGVERAIDLLKEELEMVMRLMGTPNIKDIDARALILDKSKL